MTTKLTLTIDESVIRRAKDYARKTGRSLSELVESYLEMITKSEDFSASDMSPKLKKLFGAVDIPSDLDHKKEIRKILGSKNI